MDPVIKEFDAMHLVGCRELINIAKGDFAGIEVAWDRFFALASGAIANIIESDRFWGVTNCTDVEQSYIAAKEVSAVDPGHSSYDTFAVEWSKFAVFTYHGHPKNMGPTFHAAFEWVEHSQYELAGTYTLELYDSRCDPDDMDNYIVEIRIPVK